MSDTEMNLEDVDVDVNVDEKENQSGVTSKCTNPTDLTQESFGSDMDNTYMIGLPNGVFYCYNQNEMDRMVHNYGWGEDDMRPPVQSLYREDSKGNIILDASRCRTRQYDREYWYYKLYWSDAYVDHTFYEMYLNGYNTIQLVEHGEKVQIFTDFGVIGAVHDQAPVTVYRCVPIPRCTVVSDFLQKLKRKVEILHTDRIRDLQGLFQIARALPYYSTEYFEGIDDDKLEIIQNFH